MLEELEHTYMVHVDKYRFTQTLKKSLVPIQEQIKEKSFSEFTDFLENIRKVSGECLCECLLCKLIVPSFRD